MSEDQLSALLVMIMDNAELRSKLQAAADFDALLAIVKSAGFDVSREALLDNYSRFSQLTDRDLESVAGGNICEDSTNTNTCMGEFCSCRA